MIYLVGILCLFAGATIGMFVSALMTASSNEDRCLECECKKEEKGE